MLRHGVPSHFQLPETARHAVYKHFPLPEAARHRVFRLFYLTDNSPHNPLPNPMASNRIPRKLKQLIPLGEEAAKGAQSHGSAVGLALNTAAKIRADLTRLVGDDTIVPPVVGSVAKYNRAKAAKVLATKDRNAAVQRGRDFNSATIGALSPRLGKRWSSGWNAVGFTNSSLALPDDPLPTVLSIKSYLLAHPSHEVVSPDGKVEVSATAAAVVG